MLFPLGVALTVCVGIGIVITLAARARADGSIARVLYDAEHPDSAAGNRIHRP
jgi:hypothetical protein